MKVLFSDNWSFVDTHQFASTPVKKAKAHEDLGESHIDIHTIPDLKVQDETKAAESILQSTMQTLTSKFKCSCKPHIQRFCGGTSSGALLVFQSWIQGIECTIADRNLTKDEAFRLIKISAKEVQKTI